VQTDTDELTRISSTGQETDVDLGARPAPSAPTGESGSGEVASPDLIIPAEPVPVNSVED
jgi:hypothetical protein